MPPSPDFGHHPSWCDPKLCIQRTSDADAAYVVHGAVLNKDDGCVVELLQRDVLDAATGRHVRREAARVIISSDGLEELDVPAERAAALGALLARVAARLNDTT